MARVLQWHVETKEPGFGFYRIDKWEYEPKKFYFDKERANRVWELYKRKLTGIREGVTNYTPDFRVQGMKMHESLVQGDMFDSHGIGTNHFWIEVKGFMDSKDRTKLKRMSQYYPEEEIVVVDKTWFTLNMRKYRSLIPDWETMNI